MQKKPLRYGDYLGAVRRRHRQISYNELAAFERDAPQKQTRLRPIDVHRLLTPYVSVRFLEQLVAVIPLAIMLVGFQALALRTSLLDAETIAAGILAVIVGLMLFMEGVKRGLMPFAENIGFLMPSRSPTAVLLSFGALLGVAATFAEPAIGALQLAGESLSDERAGLLKKLLGPYSSWLVAAVASGVGLAVTTGFLRTIFNWHLKLLIMIVVPICLGLTAYCASQPELRLVIGLAWDCGGITTGPVTVPLVLAVGIGVAAAAGRGDNPLAGFGIVTLASLFPVITVLGVSIYLHSTGITLEPVLAASSAASGHWLNETPGREIIGALRAILPLVLLLVLVQRFVLGQRIPAANIFIYGISLTILGMMLFNIGLTTGLGELGEQAGNNVPWAFSTHRITGEPPLYPYALGITMSLIFAFVIGYCATVAEPALNAMGITVENLTDGAFKKRLLIHAVAAGVGIGAAVGVAKILFNLPLDKLLIGGYLIAMLLTALTREEFVNLAWDSAGVTTGPVTVPLLLALGIGLGQAVGAAEGFGILAMCSLGPILSVLIIAQRIEWQERRNNENNLAEA
jgi:hypothetical protein